VITRSIGDVAARRLGCSSTPQISHHALSQQTRFVIVASDGVWDVLSNDAVVAFTSTARSAEAAALTILHAALWGWRCRHTADNVSVAVLFFHWDAPVVADSAWARSRDASSAWLPHSVKPVSTWGVTSSSSIVREDLMSVAMAALEAPAAAAANGGSNVDTPPAHTNQGPCVLPCSSRQSFATVTSIGSPRASVLAHISSPRASSGQSRAVATADRGRRWTSSGDAASATATGAHEEAHFKVEEWFMRSKSEMEEPMAIKLVRTYLGIWSLSYPVTQSLLQ
jgi:hypothetical protein